MVTAAIILAEAAAVYEDLNAVQTQSYGAAARGGVTRAEIIISESRIDFPRVTQPNTLVCLAQEAYSDYYRIIRPGGLLLVDSHYVDYMQKAEARQISLPMYSELRRELESAAALNICMLGALQELTKLVKTESILNSLSSRFSGEKLSLNEKALEVGRKLALQKQAE